MKRRRHDPANRGALQLIEEATHLLRSAPSGVLVWYYLGSLPFVFGFLYFWADMGRSPFARRHVVEASLALAVAFAWMKFCQAIFASRMRAVIAQETLPPLTFRRIVRVAFTQTALHPIGLVLVPLSLITVVPFAWVFGFFQNITVLADGESSDLKLLSFRAARLIRLWTGQNFLALLLLFALAIVVFLNLVMVGVFIPKLLETLLGVQTVFSQSTAALLNTTFLTAMLGLTYLCVDPLVKTFFALRCFYGEARTTGDDLKAELRGFARPVFALVAGVSLLFGTAAPALAAEKAPPTSAEAEPDQGRSLDRAIDDVIQQQKYVWRLPRETVDEAAPPEKEQGAIGRFFERVGEFLKKMFKGFFEFLGRILDYIFRRLMPRGGGAGRGPSIDWKVTAYLLMWIVIAVVVGALSVLAYRVWFSRQKNATIEAAPLAPTPDLSDENVSADQLPEDGWSKMARELLDRGEFRLAMRALYLATLAHLAERGLITLARFKSNRDYQSELQRRAHAMRDLLPPFGENVAAFDRAWYGLHEVGRDQVSRFAENVERIRAMA